MFSYQQFTSTMYNSWLLVFCLWRTALVDLDPAQLLLFVQSFGIPVSSMCKLLGCLDAAMGLDSVAMSGAVVDKAYMAQLVQVQHMRGATGGHVFHTMLTAASDEDANDKGQSVTVKALILFSILL